MKTLFLLLLLSVPAFAQDRVKALVPTYIAVTVTGDDSAELRADVLRELRKLRNVAIVEKRADFKVQITGARAQGECRGVVVAVLTSTPEGHDLQALAGANWQEVAKFLAERIEEDLKARK